jgi:hypothetical protein
MRLNLERWQFVKGLLDSDQMSANQIIFWAGQRNRYPKEGTDADLLDPVGRYAGSVVDHNRWVQKQLETTNPFGTETEMARLAMLKTFGGTVIFRHARIDMESRGAGVQKTRDILDVAFSVEGYPDMSLLNARAVDRPQGLARHTTASCVTEWLQSYNVEENARVLFVTGNPHTERTGAEATQILAETGRGDISLDPVGPAAHEAASLQLILGEVGRLLYRDHTRQAA